MTDPCGTPPAPGGKASGAVGRGTRPSCLVGMPQQSNQIVSKSGAVDHLVEEALIDRIKYL